MSKSMRAGWMTAGIVSAFLLAFAPFTGVALAQTGDPGHEMHATGQDNPNGELQDSGSTAAVHEEAAAETGGHEAMAEDPEHAAESTHAAEEDVSLGQELPLWSALPFVGILLSIALFPLFAPNFWHHHYPKVSAFWALAMAIPFLIAYHGEGVYEILHIFLVDYIPFIVLLLGLFTASGGILLRGSLVGKPVVNLTMLLIGTILASWMGTTGASMVLIRPVLRANKVRKNKMHVVIFFIFLVSNIGGSLTPLGDPPLFLGFLHGVPFFWTFHIFPHFALAAGLLLLVFFIIDSILYSKEKAEVERLTAGEKEPLKLEGLHNLIFLVGVMAAVLFSGIARIGEFSFFGVHLRWENEIRDLFILLMVYLSVKTTSKKIRKDNGFTWFPIQEVAYLFAGIFVTIIPALAMLRAGEDGAMRPIVDFAREPFHYFWITGALSSFLDNAPTYLTFYNLAQGRLGLNDLLVNQILTGQAAHDAHAMFVMFLEAISAGAVFFGAMTYIGNAPNFMVRSIAEENKVTMPSFFGYMLWSIGILLPTFILVTFIFFI